MYRDADKMEDRLNMLPAGEKVGTSDMEGASEQSEHVGKA
jgi:hypothetical protein